MKEPALIKSNYKKKIELIKKYDEFYHEKSKPLVSDAEYDLLKKKNNRIRNKI